MSALQLSLIILLAPLAGVVLMAAFGRVLPRRGDWLAVGLTGVSLAAAGVLFLGVFAPEPEILNFRFDWIPLDQGRDPGNGVLPAGLLIDPLMRTMCLVVAGVSFLVHLFSVGYMKGDQEYQRYFAHLQLFTFSMLGLVMANNFLTLYIFWELVGLSSYLLIGHFYHKKSAAWACMKAFITTRIGDVGMFFGILIIWSQVGSLDYEAVFAAANPGSAPAGMLEGTSGLLGGWWKTLAGLGIFFGAMGKSAQFPLHVWLPDAMEGPTPVSAMIHAATMVAAGVYLVGRVFPIFDPTVLLIIALIGAFTALFAATIALVQDDIKKVLAYSTVSQLGYMMLGLGAGSFVAGVFHMTTHASFKALLFLGSGSVIHAMHHQQSMTHYGGLRKKLPITFWTFLIATFAICGLPYITSGFYSKDLIILKSFEAGLTNFGGAGTIYMILAVIAVVTAGMTTFYMFRAVFLTFFGKPKDEHLYEHAHESPWTMTVPLVTLSVFALIAGGFSLSGETWFPKRMDLAKNRLYAPYVAMHDAPHGETIMTEHSEETAHTENQHHAMEPHAAGVHGEGPHGHSAEEGHASHAAHTAHLLTLFGTISAFLIGLALSFLMYIKGTIDPAKIAAGTRPVYNLLQAKYYIDEFYGTVFIQGTRALSRVFGWIDANVIDRFVVVWGFLTRSVSVVSGLFDNSVVDGLVNAAGTRAQSFGQVLSFFQTGRIRHYLMYSVALASLVAFVLIVAWR